MSPKPGIARTAAFSFTAAPAWVRLLLDTKSPAVWRGMVPDRGDKALFGKIPTSIPKSLNPHKMPYFRAFFTVWRFSLTSRNTPENPSDAATFTAVTANFTAFSCRKSIDFSLHFISKSVAYELKFSRFISVVIRTTRKEDITFCSSLAIIPWNKNHSWRLFFGIKTKHGFYPM